jgi:rhodanese-related sulfurtransferase
MTKAAIIEELYLSKNFNDCINKMQPEEIREDLKAEVILVVCDIDESRLRLMHESKQLVFFVVRIILNMVKSNTSAFYKKYRATTEELKENYTFVDIRDDTPTEKEHIYDITEVEQRKEKELLEDLALETIETLYWYEQELLKLYIKHGNYRAIQDATSIPFSSVYKTIQGSIKKIKCQLSL